jgi:N-acetylmuramoyl-L-alanine amidase
MCVGSVAEWDYCNLLGAMCVARAKKMGYDAEQFWRETEGQLGVTKAYERVKGWGATCAVELHFNASADPKPQGACMLFKKGSVEGSKLATCLLNRIVFGLARKSRGVLALGDGDRGGWSVANGSGVLTVIAEPFFGSNKDDCQFALVDMGSLAQTLVNGVLEYAGRV